MKKWMAVLMGFLLGVLVTFLSHPASRVHASGPLHIHVSEVPKGEHFEMQGSQVVGFSCIAIPGQSRCFVASTD